MLVVSDVVFRRVPNTFLPQPPSLPPAALAPSSAFDTFLLAAPLPPTFPPAPPPPTRASLAPSILLGDGLVLLGAVLYAASNVWQVPCVR